MLPYSGSLSKAAVPTAKQARLTLVGFLEPEGGLGKIPLDLLRCFDKDIFVNFITTRPLPHSLPPTARDLISRSSAPGCVALFTDMLWSSTHNYTATLPTQSMIKVAYSMFESTRLPPQWVKILNSKFDAVIVPDPWLVDIYQNSGVLIPIFVIPLSLSLEAALSHEPRLKTSRPFIFGNTCALEPRKNHKLLIQAFAQAFGGRADIELHINVRYDNPFERRVLTNEIAKLKLKNVKLTIRNLSSEEYLQFMRSFHCYATLSKGEGFSNTPRESLAMGVPVILTDCSAHKTIALTGFVRAVPAHISEPAHVFNAIQGYYSSCTVSQAAQALKDVYQNYSTYYQKAQQGRAWVRQYLPESLRAVYSQLARPQSVKLTSHNRITAQGIETSSLKLYEKYRTLVPQQAHQKEL